MYRLQTDEGKEMGEQEDNIQGVQVFSRDSE